MMPEEMPEVAAKLFLNNPSAYAWQTQPVVKN
jgi:hypothetical protein